ncbi:hypothetical protein FB451DRAFT_602557 [Mycena latifolia]|nr:hypothetical protein FB451DRAFT_602557 [Mycena latifolia]
MIAFATDRNPFQGRDYNLEDEDKALPRSELWGYALPEELRYEYDIRQNPTLLLRPLPAKTIIPQTKLTILVIQWAACNFGLGKKVYAAEDIDPEAFWNADPPPPRRQSMLMMTRTASRSPASPRGIASRLRPSASRPRLLKVRERPITRSCGWTGGRTIGCTPASVRCIECTDGPTRALSASSCSTRSAALRHFRCRPKSWPQST